MRYSRLFSVALPAAAAAAFAGCNKSDGLTTTVRPPLAGVRYVHAVSDTGRLDFKMYDQLDYSASTIDSIGGIRYRQASRYFPTEAKARKIRVFSYNVNPATGARPIDEVSKIMLDTTIAFDAGKNYTLLLVGSARAAAGAANRMRFVRIEDTPPAADTNVVHVRLYNANTGAPVDGYLVGAGTTAPSGTPAFSGVAPGAASAYVPRPKGTMAVRITDQGATTPVATVVADTGTAGTSLVNPVAGARVGGTAFSAFVFAPAVTGSGAFSFIPTTATAPAVPLATLFQSRSVELYVDRLPANTIR